MHGRRCDGLASPVSVMVRWSGIEVVDLERRLVWREEVGEENEVETVAKAKWVECVESWIAGV